jgi:hypothetical protein
MSATTAIVGDSYVRRLRDFCMERGAPHLNIASERIIYFGLGGATIRGPKAILPLLTQAVRMRCVQTFVIHVGSNDLCDASRSPDEVVEDLVRLARYVLAKNDTVRVHICQISQRRKLPHPSFNRRVRRVNRMLRRAVKGISRMHFARFSGLEHPPRNHFVDDGVHYNSKGLAKLQRGIRGILLRSNKPPRLAQGLHASTDERQRVPPSVSVPCASTAL